jgi:three-Cys-motif partner protein
MLSRYHDRIVYIDGFAGPGRYVGGEEGSPLIALRALLEHRYLQQTRHPRAVYFLFIERDERRAEALRRELKTLEQRQPPPAWIKYDVLAAEFATAMSGLLDDLEKKRAQLAPTFAFVDPFGFSGAPLKVIARIVDNPRCECFITFMYESVTRFLSHPNPEIQANFDNLFGTQDWRAVLEESDADRRREAIIQLYRHQLLTHANLRYVRTFEMIDRGNRTEYFLYFGTNSLDGLSRMKQAMWKADPARGQMFSDRTVSGQMVLLEPEPDLTQLQVLLQQRFRDRGWVGIDQISDFVLVETPFSEAMHLKRKTLAVMERHRPALLEVQRPEGVRKVAGIYPPGTRIKIL